MPQENWGAVCSSRTSSPSTALEQPARRVLDYLAAKAPFKVPLENGDTEGAQTDEAAISQTPDIVAAAVQYIRELFALCKVRTVTGHASLDTMHITLICR